MNEKIRMKVIQGDVQEVVEPIKYERINRGELHGGTKNRTTI